MMPRGLAEAETSLWFEAMRDARPLRGRRAPVRTTGRTAEPPAAAPPPVVDPAQAARPPDRPGRVRPPVEIGRREEGLDDTSWRALSSGQMRAQRRLDLHGRTAQHAFEALHSFLLRAQAERLRCVEVITGAGSGPEGGILRRELPHWLARHDLRHLVLAAVHPHRRNVGSVRLLLRRRSG